MNLYSIDVKIAATAYIQANSEEEALAKARMLKDEQIGFPDCREQIGDEIFMTGEPFNSDMPEVSLSPVMTIHGPFEDQTPDLAEEFDNA